MTEWLRCDRKPILLADPSFTLSEMCFHLTEWPQGEAPATLSAVVELFSQIGLAAFPKGPFPLMYGRLHVPERELPARLAERLPETDDLLRLLSLRSGDWSDSSDEYRASFWGDPTEIDVDAMDFRAACERALDRGDPALADIRLGCWLIFWLLGTRRPLPHIPDIARVIRRVPVEDRSSVHARIGLITAELANDAEGSRQLAVLLSYLPPIQTLGPSDPEADLRDHVGAEQWGWLSNEERSVLLAAELQFRDWRRLGPANAESRRPVMLVTQWAALFEPLIRRALGHCGAKIAQKARAKITLGQALELMEKARHEAESEPWLATDDRRRHLLDDVWMRMLKDLNTANTQGGKHLPVEGPALAWHEVAALRSRVIFGGALRHAIEVAGKPISA